MENNASRAADLSDGTGNWLAGGSVRGHTQACVADARMKTVAAGLRPHLPFVRSLASATGNTTGANDTTPFTYIEDRTFHERVIGNLRLVHELNRRIGATARRNWIVGTVYELNSEICAVAMGHAKMRHVVGNRILAQANRRAPNSLVGWQELNKNFCEACHRVALLAHRQRLIKQNGSTSSGIATGDRMNLWIAIISLEVFENRLDRVM